MVTGASSGIGFDLARLFADDGYSLIVAAGENEIRAFRQTGRYRCRVMAVQGDLRKPPKSNASIALPPTVVIVSTLRR